MLDKEKIRESLTEEDITKILLDLGAGDPQRDREGNMVYRTICHGGNKHKLYYYDDSKMFHCYSGCQTSFDIYALVLKVKKWENNKFPEVIKYVANVSGKWLTKDYNKETETRCRLDLWKNFGEENTKQDLKLTNYSKNVLNVFINKPHELWINEGISEETMKTFDISYYSKEDRIIIPHFDIDGNLVGIRGRALLEEDVQAGKKYMPVRVNKIEYSHSTRLNWYGLNITKEAIKRRKTVKIFESEKSVMKLYEWYGNDCDAVASGGSSISPTQLKILEDLGVEKIYLCYDKEYTDDDNEQKQRYGMKLIKAVHSVCQFKKVYLVLDNDELLQCKDSPCDRGKEVFEYLVRESEKIENNCKVTPLKIYSEEEAKELTKGIFKNRRNKQGKRND
jgi:hypothetical protein